jgi:hypothetical protein
VSSSRNIPDRSRLFGERVEERWPVAPAGETGLEDVDTQDSDASAMGADEKAVAADLATVVTPDAAEPELQSAATASLQVWLYPPARFPTGPSVGGAAAEFSTAPF